MLISGYPRPNLAGPRLGAATVYTSSGAPATGVQRTGLAVRTGDILVLAWFRTSVSSVGNTFNLWYGADNTGTKFTQINLWGTQGATQRAMAWAGYVRGAAQGTSKTLWQEAWLSSTAIGPQFGDYILCVCDLIDWGGTVGNSAGQNTTSAATNISQALTPGGPNSLLVGVAGAFDNNAMPYVLTAGWDKVAESNSGASGGALVDGAACFPTLRAQSTSAATLQATAASSLSPVNWSIGVIELK